MGPTLGYDPIGTVQQAITSLLSTQEPTFIGIGTRMFLSFATKSRFRARFGCCACVPKGREQ